MLTQFHPDLRPTIRGVLFDMDGLVLDTEKLYSRFWMEACHFYGFPMTYEQSLRMRSANSRLGAANLQAFFGPTADYKAIRAKRIQLMEAWIDENGVEPKPGIYELLDYLAETLSKMPAPAPFQEEEWAPDLLADSSAWHIEKDGHVFVVVGAAIEQLVGSVNFNDEESLNWFHRTMRRAGIIDALRRMGANEGSTVRMENMEFDFVE